VKLPKKSLSIDEEGFPFFGETRIQDPEVGAEILQNLTFAENDAFMTELRGENYLVEAFDEPLVVQHIDLGHAKIQVPYSVTHSIIKESLTVDEWDRFHGYTKSGLPFVLSRKAQAELFNSCDEFDDESITFDGIHYEILPYWDARPKLEEEFWNNRYSSNETGWELNEPAPAFADMLPRLKLPRSRILVLGCGSGEDAALFAREGHFVTAVDFSEEALQRAQAKFSGLNNIKFVKADAFKLPVIFEQAFDVVVEHTFYCAVSPERRNDLIKVWRRCLADGGQLMGVFFAMERKNAPPFGGTEWELRERLKKSFQFLFWGRWNQSVQQRNGKELFVLAQKNRI
jgi:SAM-dependent methyltransferase